METPEQPQTTPLSEQPEPPKQGWFSTHKLFGYGFLAIIFVLIAGGVYAWQYGGSTNPPSVNPGQTYSTPADTSPPPTNPVTPDPTADWQTYSSEELGFTFKHPVNVSISEDLKKNFYTEDNKDFLTVTFNSSELNGLVLVNDPGRGFQIYNDVAVKSESLNIDGVTSTFEIFDTRLESVPQEDQERGVFVQFQKNSDDFFLWFHYLKSGPDQENLVRQILSTFKFIAPTLPSPDPTANWQTYRNEKYGYEVKYPAEITTKTSFSGLNNSLFILTFDPPADLCNDCGGNSRYLHITVGPGEVYECDEASGTQDGFITISGQEYKKCVVPGNFEVGQSLLVSVPQTGTSNIVYFGADLYNENASGVDQILSTFKFIE